MRQSAVADASPSPSVERRASPPTEPPTVSVVIIFHNAERFLDEAVASVFAQSFQDWELLLVDDGSTDRSTACARGHALQHPDRVGYLEHPGHANRGMSAARNVGIRAARGRYVAFLDADDQWMPSKLEEQVAILDANPEVDLVYGAMRYWWSWTGQSDAAALDHVPDLGMPLECVSEPPVLVTRMLRRQAAAPAMSSALVRRAAAFRVGLFEERFRGMHEDQVFVAKLAFRSRVYVSGACWHWYRQHPDSCLAVVTTSGRRPAARRRYLRWLRRYLAREGAKGGGVWQVVEEQLRSYRLTFRLQQRGKRLARAARRSVAQLARRVLPSPLHARLRQWWSGPAGVPAPGAVAFGSLRRLEPISRRWGKDRGGRPIDRVYIERFLADHAGDIHGRVLEVQDARYTTRFGGERVTRSEVLHVSAGNPAATIVADLACAPQIPSDSFDCVILTQVLLCIEDVESAIRTIHRILRPGGVVLATVPGISQVVRHDMERWGDYWRFTTLSARRLFERVFPADAVQVESHGNVLAAVAFLHGLAADELRPEELAHQDPDYQLLLTIRAVRPPLDAPSTHPS